MITVRSKLGKMAVISTTSWFLKPLVDPKSDPRVLKYFIISYCLLMLFILTGSVCYIVDHSDNFADFPEPFYLIAIWALISIKFVSFICHKERIQAILKSIQIIADQSMKHNGGMILIQTISIEFQRRRRQQRNSTKTLSKCRRNCSKGLHYYFRCL